MNSDKLTELLEQVASGAMAPASAVERLKKLPYEDLGFAKVDHHRVLRRGFPEVIYGAGKTPEQITAIGHALRGQGAAVLVTRVDPAKAEEVCAAYPELEYHPDCACLSLLATDPPRPGKGVVVVIAAGTSDLPVANEAALTARLMGSTVETVYDVGVSGLHRLAASAGALERASAFVVVAGMEGALPSVVAGMVDKPVVAVPTSVGYGTSFGGLAALLGMLNSCAPGLSVVNIDNGFGGGYLAGLIDHLE
ncbi:MAG: nickel pincer cofactor biosynthesis protein LarB [Desulfarculaceae bacterium]|nr:nickel pincer cofactor biosynthesis protein LarB [Desulfarculaceae bacterium]